MTSSSKGRRPSGAATSTRLRVTMAAFKSAIWAALMLAAMVAFLSPRQFGERCMLAFGFLLTTGLGGLFFVLLHHLLQARWSSAAVVHMRAAVELIAWSMPLLVPIALSSNESWPWLVPRGEEHVRNAFAGIYHQAPFVLTRLAACCLAWLLLAFWYTHDETASVRRGQRSTRLRRLQFWSGPSLVVFALTVTSFSFDWVMSMQRGWHSAVLGVYVFAGAVPAALAVLALVTLGLETFGIGPERSPIEERHDIGKLLFGFTVFWAYIAFSQYLLIWYADIPSETAFYLLRTGPAWRALTLWLIVFHFVVPFAMLLSARAKRSPLWLALAALSMLGGHYLDWYWLVLPALRTRGAAFGFADASTAAISWLAIGWVMVRGFARNSPMTVENRAQASAAE